VSPLDAKWEAPKRLAGFQKVEVKPGAAIRSSIAVDPRLLAVYDSATKTWRVAAGEYKVVLATDAGEAHGAGTVVRLADAVYDVNGRPLKYGH